MACNLTKHRIFYRIPAAFLAVCWPLLVHAVRVKTYLESYPWYPDVPETTDFFLVWKGRVLCVTAACMLLLLLLRLLCRGRAEATGQSLPGKRRGRKGASATAFPGTGKEQAKAAGKYAPVKGKASAAGERRVVWGGVGIFLAGALASAFLSKNPGMVWRGMSEQYESLPVILSYLVIAAYIAVFFRAEDRTFLRRALLAGAALQSAIGILQLSGQDFFLTAPGRALIGAGSAGSGLTEYIFAGDAGHRVYLCFYHPNYAAVYLMLMLPLSGYAFLESLLSVRETVHFTRSGFCPEAGSDHGTDRTGGPSAREKAGPGNGSEGRKRTNILAPVGYGILTLLLVLCLAGTGSKTAFAVLLVCAAAAVAWHLGGHLQKRLRRSRRTGGHLGEEGRSGKQRSTVAFVCAGLLLAALLIFAGFLLQKGNPELFQGALERILGEKTQRNLLDVEPGADGVRVNWKGKELLLTMQQEEGHAWFSALDSAGQTLPMAYREDTERFEPADPAFSGLTFDAWTDKGTLCITMYQEVRHPAKDTASEDAIPENASPENAAVGEAASEEIPWYFRYPEGADSWQYITLYRKRDTPVHAAHVTTFGYDNAFSGRAYLWSRALPLLRSRILAGSGPDGFTLSFPQNDYAAKANVGLDLLMPVISRAHSLYLQCAVQFGVLPSVGLLAALLALLLGRVQDGEKGRGFRTACRLSLLLWLLMGLTNDSVLPVTPFACMIAGAASGKA